ncbi:MAG: Phage terminase, large subunit [Candidatus Eremiobacteraeota bacterium]|nr:Phage terminase, large subunit [Candidatus Eremiobacteraeota bacterium]
MPNVIRSDAQKRAAFAERLRRYKDDPIGFCRDVLDMDPHEGQQRWLTESGAGQWQPVDVKSRALTWRWRTSENALTTGNRWGKSHTAAAKRIWKAVYRKGWDDAIKAAMRKKHAPYRGINISLTADQAGLVWRKAFGMLQGPKAAWLLRDVKMTPFPTFEFLNGALFEARSTARDGFHLLGNDYDDVNWDEAAFEPKFGSILDNVLRMRLVDRRGTLDYTSTGNGRNEYGRFFLEARAGKLPGVYAQTGPSYENPHVPADEVKRIADRVSDQKRRQNIGGEIVDNGGDFFPGDDITAFWDSDLNDQIDIVSRDDEQIPTRIRLMLGGQAWETRYPSHRYVHGWDLAERKDWATGFTIDTTTMVDADGRPLRMPVVEYERFHKQGWKHVYARIRDRHARYGGSARGVTVVDSTGVGDTVVEELEDIRAEGYWFTGPAKDDLLANLQSALSTREVRGFFVEQVNDELSFYDRNDKGLVKDCVMGLALAVLWAMRNKPRPMLLPRLV